MIIANDSDFLLLTYLFFLSFVVFSLVSCGYEEKGCNVDIFIGNDGLIDLKIGTYCQLNGPLQAMG